MLPRLDREWGCVARNDGGKYSFRIGKTQVSRLGEEGGHCVVTTTSWIREMPLRCGDVDLSSCEALAGMRK
jgi:hypothetical protein